LVSAVDWMQDEDSCWRSGQCETPQVRSDEEAHGSPADSEVLHGNQQRCLTDKCNTNMTVISEEKEINKIT
jgi:hypothetical protein